MQGRETFTSKCQRRSVLHSLRTFPNVTPFEASCGLDLGIAEKGGKSAWGAGKTWIVGSPALSAVVVGFRVFAFSLFH
jgi:hypothetical protein